MMRIVLKTLLAPDAYVWIAVVLLAVLTVALVFSWRRIHRRWLRWLYSIGLLGGWYFLLYGTFIGFTRLTVRQVELSFSDLPASFDGYRIVQFSDAHVGSYTGWREGLLQTAIDSIMAQKADMVVYTGDLQNKLPQEIRSHQQTLSQIRAKDGVYSVLGNHDYAEYVKCCPEEAEANCLETQQLERSLGWTLLMNEHRVVRHGSDSIIIAGMENDGEGRFPALGDIPKTLDYPKIVRRPSIDDARPFIVMLEHDPTSWHRKILPECEAQLTLSGHTHGGQFAFWGFSPAQFKYSELGGVYREGDRVLHVTTGLGGVVPVRFGVTPEIVVITLRKK